MWEQIQLVSTTRLLDDSAPCVKLLTDLNQDSKRFPMAASPIRHAPSLTRPLALTGPISSCLFKTRIQVYSTTTSSMPRIPKPTAPSPAYWSRRSLAATSPSSPPIPVSIRLSIRRGSLILAIRKWLLQASNAPGQSGRPKQCSLFWSEVKPSPGPMLQQTSKFCKP